MARILQPEVNQFNGIPARCLLPGQIKHISVRKTDVTDVTNVLDSEWIAELSLKASL